MSGSYAYHVKWTFSSCVLKFFYRGFVKVLAMLSSVNFEVQSKTWIDDDSERVSFCKSGIFGIIFFKRNKHDASIKIQLKATWRQYFSPFFVSFMEKESSIKFFSILTCYMKAYLKSFEFKMNDAIPANVHNISTLGVFG